MSGKIDATYYKSPTEIHARINEIRNSLKLKPDDIVTENMFSSIANTTAGMELLPYIKNKKLFIDTMNKIPVLVPAAGLYGLTQSKKQGGNLSRKEDYKSKNKPYPSVDKKDFAGGERSYPIPTKADAVDALRLAGLHGRSDVKAKVYKKYPELKK